MRTNKETETAKQKAVRSLKEKLKLDKYFLKMYDNESYFFDSEIITEEEVDKNLKIEGYNAYQDSIDPKEVLNLLNRLSEENESLRAYNNYLKDEKMLLIKENAELKEIVNANIKPKTKKKQIRDEYYTITSHYNPTFLKEVKETSKQEDKIVIDIDELFKE